MSPTIEITMTGRGFIVNLANRTERFAHLEDALDFARQRLQHAQDLRDLSARCE
jgi:hypothetical protein